jgi:hypothetical protein
MFYFKVGMVSVGSLFCGMGGMCGRTNLLQVRQASFQELLLLRSQLANLEDLLRTVRAELHLRGEEVDALVLVQWALNEGRLNDTLLALGSLQQALGETGTSHGHRQSGGSSAILSLNDLVTTELHTLEQGGVADQVRVGGLREERNDGDTGVTTNNGDVLIDGVGALELAHESRGTNDIQGGDTEETLGVVDTGLLEDLSDDRDGAVDWVGDDEDVGVGGGFGSGLGEVADDGGVGVEEVVTSHSGLARNTGRNQNDLGTLEGGVQSAGGWLIAGDLALGVDVANIGGDT